MTAFTLFFFTVRNPFFHESCQLLFFSCYFSLYPVSFPLFQLLKTSFCSYEQTWCQGVFQYEPTEPDLISCVDRRHFQDTGQCQIWAVILSPGCMKVCLRTSVHAVPGLTRRLTWTFIHLLLWFYGGRKSSSSSSVQIRWPKTKNSTLNNAKPC